MWKDCPEAAELELSVLTCQCLDRRVKSVEELLKELGLWEEEWNDRAIEVDWQFTTDDVRIKLRKLYPGCSKRLNLVC